MYIEASSSRLTKRQIKFCFCFCFKLLFSWFWRDIPRGKVFSIQPPIESTWQLASDLQVIHVQNLISGCLNLYKWYHKRILSLRLQFHTEILRKKYACQYTPQCGFSPGQATFSASGSAFLFVKLRIWKDCLII